MRKSKRGSLAFRDAFLAGRLGIRRKIMIYLLILAGFIISMVWLFQNALLFYVYRGSEILGTGSAPVVVMSDEDEDEARTAVREKNRDTLRLEVVTRWEFLVIVTAILLATGLVGYSMAKSISDPIIETNEAARELGRGRYTRPPTPSAMSWLSTGRAT